MNPPDSAVSLESVPEPRTNPYQSPQVQCEFDPAKPTHRRMGWRIYLFLHVAAVVAAAFGSLDDSGVLNLPGELGAALTLVGFPFLFISPGVGVTMLVKGIFKPRRYAMFAAAELLLWGTHFYALLPTVQ